MRVKVKVEFIVDDEDVSLAESEVEAQLGDLLNYNSATAISEFHILGSQTIETETEDF